MTQKYIVICTDINEITGNPETVRATSKQFNSIEEAQKYADTVNSGRYPVAVNINDFPTNGIYNCQGW